MNDTTRRYPRTVDEAFRTPSWRAGMDERLSHVIAFHGAMRPDNSILGARQLTAGSPAMARRRPLEPMPSLSEITGSPLAWTGANRAHENAWRSRSHDERRDSPERRAQIPRRERIAGRIVATLIGIGLAALVVWGTQ
jgi:hypothetical protein